MKKLKLGVIGLSDGNGHPYSWAAIFNGFDTEEMSKCPFPSIPEYLGKEQYPENFLGKIAEVTCIWTQDRKVSELVAAASKITIVVDNLEEMLGQVDAVLLARDDAEHHFEMAKPFIEAGIPIFIDKPLALSFDIVNTMFSLQKYPSQIYSCSALRYAEELQLTRQDIEKTGAIVHVEASVMKKWETYSVHLIEPIVAQLPKRGNLINVEVINTNPIYQVSITWEHCTAYIKVTGSIPSPITFTYFGEKGSVTKLFANSFDCFKTSLESFVNQIRTKEISINRKETLEIIEIIEKGIYG